MKSRLLILLAMLIGMIFLCSLFVQPTFASNNSLTGNKICIDPGHGGSDPGAVNADFYLFESHINLDVSYGLKWLLEQKGAEVVMTRTDDTYKDNNDRYTFCNSEAATILISIHTNSVVDPTWDGSMALYFHPDDDDLVLAQTIYAEMYPLLKESAPDPELFMPFGLDWFASGVLLKSNMPAAMLEPLFMSNPSEAALLVEKIFEDPNQNQFTDECINMNCRRGEIAQAVYQGILNYFDTVAEGVLHVSAMDMTFEQKAKNYFIYSYVTIVDQNENPVSGAAVEITLILPDGSEFLLSEISGIDGMAIFKLKSNLTGIYKTEVTNVSKDGWNYDEDANIEESEFLEIP